MDQVVLSRMELYELVWKESMLSLSKRFDISDVGLRKICIRMEIPVPASGHWAKIQFGKKVERAGLPPNYKGEETVQLGLRDKNNLAANHNSLKSKKVSEVVNDSRVVLQVPEKLKSPDVLVSITREVLSKQKPDTFNYIGTVSSSHEALDIRVAKANVGRALLFFDTLIKCLKARGHSIEIRNRETFAFVGVHDFRIFLREKMRKESVQDGNWTRQVFYPKGILSLQIGGWYGKEYKDGRESLEGQLSKIVAGLELSAEERTRQNLEYEKAAAERRERERVTKELEERKKQELLNFKKLVTDSERWHKAENLRRYIQELEYRAEKNQSTSPERLAWLEWAKRKADWYDPFIEAPDELLADVNLNTLDFQPKAAGYNWEF